MDSNDEVCVELLESLGLKNVRKFELCLEYGEEALVKVTYGVEKGHLLGLVNLVKLYNLKVEEYKDEEVVV